MAMDRRQFVAATGGVTAVAAAFSAGAAEAKMPDAKSRTDAPGRNAPRAPAELERAFQGLLHWMNGVGWGDYLLRAAGFDLRLAIGAEEGEIFRDLAIRRNGAFKGFEDFAGLRAIQPGDPAMSLLYHALASSDVRPLDQEGRLIHEALPEPRHVDLLENYITVRAAVPADINTLIPAVFAYEYRPSSKTPHGQHSDFVFARTGVARTGTHPAVYDPLHRTYVAQPVAPHGADTSPVTPARFGVFLARRMRNGAINRIGVNSLDDGLDFLLPVRKLYDGAPELRGHGVAFAQAHRDEKLARLAGEVSLPTGTNFDLNCPPFVRKSSSRADSTGTVTLVDHDTDLVELRREGGSALIVPAPGPLVQFARQGSQLCRFDVPRATGGSSSNRRYTTLRLVENGSALAWNFILSDWIFGGGSYTTGLRAPQNLPAFVNIRHRVEDDGQVTHLGETRAGLMEIALGGYSAAMFTDGLCDGCVTAEFTPPRVEQTASSAVPLPWKEVLPAFSVVAAPDFFPRFDPNDLSKFDGYFFEGGTETTSGGRLQANPFIPLPGRSESAFPLESDHRLARTITAAISLPPTAKRGSRLPDTRQRSINTLPDTISHVFAPGWDITYSNSPKYPKNADKCFLATFGLGSPFPEDMKLCAAANGMWAGSSPDASRTFYPDLKPFFFVGRPASAVPLTDAELGFHPESPAVADHGRHSHLGWDGEHGPFIVVDADADAQGKSRFAINFADLLLSDYVANAKQGQFDLGRMRDLGKEEVLNRMDALGRCIRRLPGGGRVRSTDFWLVAAEAVENWDSGAQGLGIPLLLGLHNAERRIAAAPGIKGAGWLYTFAREHGDPRTADQPGRRVQPCTRLYVCQISTSKPASRVRYVEFDARHHPEAVPQWR